MALLSSAGLDEPVKVTPAEATESPAPARDRAESPKPEHPRTSPTAAKKVRRTGAKRGGRRAGTKNTAPEERDRYCKEYLGLNGRIKLMVFCRARGLKETTFCYWLRDYKIRNPNRQRNDLNS